MVEVLNNESDLETEIVWRDPDSKLIRLRSEELRVRKNQSVGSRALKIGVNIQIWTKLPQRARVCSHGLKMALMTHFKSITEALNSSPWLMYKTIKQHLLRKSWRAKYRHRIGIWVKVKRVSFIEMVIGWYILIGAESADLPYSRYSLFLEFRV